MLKLLKSGVRPFQMGVVVIAAFLLLAGCQENPAPQVTEAPPEPGDAYLIHFLNDQLTEAIVQDGFPPPVAARAYAYPNVAAYEAVALADDRFASMTGQLNGLTPLPQPEAGQAYNWRLVMIEAFTAVAKERVYRNHIVERARTNLMAELEKEQPAQEVVKRSVAYGQQLAAAINQWADADGYNRTRSMPRFQPSDEPGAWEPTPPTFGVPIEPYWYTLRPFVLDSGGQFSAFPPPEPFNSDSQSAFFQLAREIYEAVNNIDEEELAIAKYWDCNPAVSINQGHIMRLKRQLTPGGHWMGITKIACQKTESGLAATCEAYAHVAMALADGFISAWHEKYRSNLIRPETYINRYIDPDWRPLLETPMFPEHVSAHSTISRAAAEVLTNLFGDNFAYVDSVNTAFGLPPRSFQSFYEASDEAAISRIYGGIHYDPACKLGIKQGMLVGRYHVQQVQTRK